jgi:hypothetical protein
VADDARQAIHADEMQHHDRAEHARTVSRVNDRDAGDAHHRGHRRVAGGERKNADDEKSP